MTIKKEVVKMVRDITIERREDNGKTWFTLLFPNDGWNKAYTLKDAVRLAEWYIKTGY